MPRRREYSIAFREILLSCEGSAPTAASRELGWWLQDLGRGVDAGAARVLSELVTTATRNAASLTDPVSTIRLVMLLRDRTLTFEVQYTGRPTPIRCEIAR